MAIDSALPAAAAVPAAPAPVRERAPRVADLLVVGSLLWWATALTWGTGGREPHLVSVGLVLATVAAAAVRPWQALSRVALAACVLPVFGAALVVLLAPTGRAGEDVAASWALTGILAAVVAAWATTGERRLLLLGALAAAPGLSFGRGWLAWWGSEDPTRPFVGTFYWHNQEGIFLALGVLCCLGLTWVLPRRVVWACWVGAAVCGAGVVLSTSRGSMLALAGVLGALAVLGAIRRDVRMAVTPVCAAVVGLVLSRLLSGPPFFAHSAGSFAGTAARASKDQSLGVNGGYRLADWGHAWKVWQHWPVTGSGFHGFRSASVVTDPAGVGSGTAFAHNDLLQVLAEGGLLLALPLAFTLVVVALAALRAGRLALMVQDWPRVWAAAAFVLLMGHSLMDFDWSYPSLLVTFGLVGVLAAAPRARTAERGAGRVVLALLVLGLAGTLAVLGWDGGMHLNSPVGSWS